MLSHHWLIPLLSHFAIQPSRDGCNLQCLPMVTIVVKLKQKLPSSYVQLQNTKNLKILYLSKLIRIAISLANTLQRGKGVNNLLLPPPLKQSFF